MSNMDPGALIDGFLNRIQEHSDQKTQSWWQNYVKDSAPFRGVRMAQIRKALHDWYHENGISDLYSAEEQKSLASELIRQKYSEDKLAGILLLHEILLPAGLIHWKRDLPVFADYFRNGFIYDWNLCDWFCVKVLNDLIATNDLSCAESVSRWHSAENLWQARASVVSFVNNVNHEPYHPLIFRSCSCLIQRPERFAKTAVGWVLRELSLVKKVPVLSFIDEHFPHFTSEVLKNSIIKLSKNEKAAYKKRLRRDDHS